MANLNAIDPIEMAQATVNIPKKVDAYLTQIQENYEGFTEAQEEQVGLYQLLIGKRKAFYNLTDELAENELRQAGEGNPTDTKSELSKIKNYLSDIANKILQKDEASNRQEYHLKNVEICLEGLGKAQGQQEKFRTEFDELQKKATRTQYDGIISELDIGLGLLNQRRTAYESGISQMLGEVADAEDELAKTGQDTPTTETEDDTYNFIRG